MGMFDNKSNKQFNNAISNYADDKIDIVKCDKDCLFRDTENSRCIYETCILKYYSKPLFHRTLTIKCPICGNEYKKELTEFESPILALIFPLCDTCKLRLKEIVNND